MPLPTVPDHMYVQAIFSRDDGDECVNTFCFRNHRDIPGESFQDAALRESMRDLLDSFYGTGASEATTVGGNLSGAVHSLRYVIYDLGQPLGGAVEIDSATFRTAPGSATGRAPADVAIAITWRTGLRGRSYRGRTYLGPLGSSTIDSGGRLNAAQRDRIVGAAPKLIGDPATRDWQICVLSRVQSVATPVTSADIDHEFDTQRRRGHPGAPRTLIPAP